MNLPRHPRRLLLAALFALALASSCAKIDRGAQPAPLRLAIYRGATLFHVAESLGYFAEEGLAVRLEELGATSKTVEALLGGSADVAFSGLDLPTRMLIEGHRVPAFLVVTLRTPASIAVSPKAKHPVRRIEDLKGAVVGVQPGSSGHRFINYVLMKHGMTPNDITTMATGGGPATVAALEQGSVDAAMALPPHLAMLRRKHPNLVVLANAQSDEGMRDIFGVARFPVEGLLAPESWLPKNPETTRKLVRAVLKTMRWAKAHTAAEYREKVPEALRLPDAEAEIEAHRVLLDSLSTDGLMGPEGPAMMREMAAASDEKIRNTAVDLKRTFTNEFVSAP